jgi:plastocyanin
MTKFLALMLAGLALCLAVAGCGGDDEESGGGGASTTEQPADTGGGGGGGGTEVTMENIQFRPEQLTVSAGDTITFTNNESVPHDVHKRSGPGEDFASGPPGEMQEGDTFELTLEEPGQYEYVCEVHAPGMSGTITVR